MSWGVDMTATTSESAKVLAVRRKQRERGCRRIDSTLDPRHSEMFKALLEERRKLDENAGPKDVLQEMVRLAYRVRTGEATLIDSQKSFEFSFSKSV